LKKPRSLSSHPSLHGEVGDFCDRTLVVHEGVEEETTVTFKHAELDDFIHIEHCESKHHEVGATND
jgi:hypothetical protein